MTLLEAGESLGTRYKVSKVPDVPCAGAFFEAIDRGATVVRAQLLGEIALSPAQHAEVRRLVTALPALPSLLRPRDLVLSSRSLPVAIFDRPALEALRPRLSDMTAEKGKRPMVTSLLRWVAQVSADLSHAHGAGVMHGAINAQLLAVNTRNEAEPCLLTGFGLSAVARSLSPDAEALTARRDLVDLLAALHELFLMAGAQPEGSASSKWTLLRHSAMHGEHPALASAMSLSNALNEIASMPDDADLRPARMPTMISPPRPGARSVTEVPTTQPRSPTERPPGPRSRLPPALSGALAEGSALGSSAGSALGSASGSATGSAARPSRVRFSWPIVMGGSIVVAGVMSAGVFHAWKVRSEVTTGRVSEFRVGSNAGLPRCEGEPSSPVNSVRTERPPVERSAACSPDGQGFVVTARVEDSLLFASRASARGSAWTHLRVAQGVVEAGSALPLGGSAWVAWRNGVGPPIGLARVNGSEAASLAVPLDGWDVVPLRGAFVAHATAREVYVITNVESGHESHAVLLSVALSPLGGRSPVVSWFLGAGAVESVIPGADPVLLVHQRAVAEHTLSVATVHTQALSRAPAPSEATTVQGATLPPGVMERSATVNLPGDALRVAPHGIAATRTFLVSTGPARVRDDCRTSARCPGAGRVSLVSFGSDGRGAVREIDANAWGEDLVARAPEGFEALLVGVNPRGEPLGTHSLRGYNSQGPDALASTVRNVGPVGALTLRCGQDAWAVFLTGAHNAASGLGALPLACVGWR